MGSLTQPWEMGEVLKRMPHSIWRDARRASLIWISLGGGDKRWNDAITECQSRHTDFSWKEIATAFEIQRDDEYIKHPHEDDYDGSDDLLGSLT